MKSELKQSSSWITLDNDFTSNGRVYLQLENEGGGASTTVPLSRLRHLVNTFPPVKPTQIEIQLYDALENIICELYADGPSEKGEAKAQRALARFGNTYGQRHDGKWRDESNNG